MEMLTVKKIDSKITDVKALSEIMDKCGIESHSINCINWSDYPYKPDVKFRIAHNGDSVLLNFRVQEYDTRAMCLDDNSLVCKDSCVEFFIRFNKEGAYYNIECNCIGTALTRAGVDRQGRVTATLDLVSKIKRYSSLGSGNTIELDGSVKWELSLIIPKELFFMESIANLSGMTATANFYKCGDDMKTPHYVSWSPIDSEKPNFHLPEFFSKILFE